MVEDDPFEDDTGSFDEEVQMQAAPFGVNNLVIVLTTIQSEGNQARIVATFTVFQ